MNLSRTPEDICLICKTNKADKEGSHFTPIGMIKKVVGNRDYEHEVTISPGEGKIDQFYGRSNLNNSDTEIRQSDNVADFIFCTDCEANLGKIESECINRLHDFSKKIEEEKLQIKVTKAGNNYFDFAKPNKNTVTLFFYTIIWRQILLDSLLHKVQFPESFIETLRNIIDNEIKKSIAEIEKSEDYKTYPKLIIYTSYHKESDTTGYTYNPNPYPSNPELFTIGTYETLIFKSDKLSPHFNLETRLPNSILDSEIVINDSAIGVISIIDFKIWDSKQKFFYAKFANDFINHFVIQITNATKLDFEAARQLLMAETHLIAKTTRANNYGDFLNEASKNVIAKNS
jgi:hypothetical protein